jgi:hypothetical protein
MKQNSLMKILKKYLIVIIVVLPLLILILYKTFNAIGFKYDAKRWSVPSFNGSNIISTSELGSLPGSKLIINLDNGNKEEFDKSACMVDIPPDSILERKNIKAMRDHKGLLLLYSMDPALSARIWMVISQTGIRNIYILTSDRDNEIFKYKFRPDTLIRPEFIN